MTTVFISGSMRIKNLDENVRFRLKHIIDAGFDVIVGDADGVMRKCAQVTSVNCKD